MKKVLIYFCVFLMLFFIIFFIIPVICTVPHKKEEQVQETIAETENTQIQEEYNYEKYKTIKLLHSETMQIEELNIDEYLYGVVSSEMPANFELEALKAQAVVARTYTIYQIIHNSSKHENADICDNYSCCQAWISKEERFSKWNSEEAESNWDKIVQAVNETKGKIVTYNKQPINAFFHANSGGVTESSLNIWSGIDYPYLKSVETSGEEGYTQYASEVIWNKQELLEKIQIEYEDCEIDFDKQDSIEILEYTSSGRVKTIKIGNKEIAGTEARTLLGLKSTNFVVTIDGENIIFSVTGYGHGVGMSQTGADSLAKQGLKYEEIIKHFYTNVEIIDVNSL